MASGNPKAGLIAAVLVAVALSVCCAGPLLLQALGK